ncbi:M16 family metallopeptidase [Marinivivus vitaminiproducens]|uniref:M16 family metallopeptidase n=1 Tax=Marinivivus vitaminiproducens TaxID=3035935 RepID=UPI0027A51FAD|nr:pitrilysin family protein [Geminicoccaceae bacterium SCSIO 64248]
MRETVLGIGTAALILGASQAAHAGMFNPETFTLENGMKVVVIPNRRAPVVSHWVWYNVGSADSPLGQSGIAHFLEHLMFKGTDTIPPGEFSRRIARNGGNDNAFTSNDFTAYFQNIARDRLEMVMEMEADRMTNLRLRDEDVLPERDVVLEERSQRVDNDPGARLGEALDNAQFMHHPYRLPIIGWRHEMAQYDREKALAFYRDHYAPNNAVLIVAGDVDAAELRPLAERIYGSIPPRDLPPRTRVQEPPQEAARRVTLSDPRVRQPSMSRSYLAPSYSAGDTAQAYPLQVLAEVLGGGGTSRLYRELVVNQQLAVGVGAFYRPTALDLSSFRVYATPRPGVDLEAVEAAVDAEIRKVLAEGVTEDEVARARKRMSAASVYARDSLGTAARTLGTALTTGRTVEDVEAWPDRIRAVTAEQVNAAAKAVLVAGHSVTGLLLPSAPSEGASAQPEGEAPQTPPIGDRDQS